MRSIIILIVLFVSKNAFSSPLHAISLEDLLNEGPLISIKQSPEGKFLYATAIVKINAPLEVVWNLILDLEHYSEFMPRVKSSKVQSKSNDGNEICVNFEISVPLANQRYTLKYLLDRERKIINIVHVTGDLKGSWWRWQLMPSGKGTLVQYWGVTKNYSRLLEKFEDERQTVTVGINVSSMMTITRTIKQRAEKLYSGEM
ncbi:MAG: SRPBCC family protein [Spirochaetes bacterium]|nr:SRPBCC family protein [Spirochaetota bacterium]